MIKRNQTKAASQDQPKRWPTYVLMMACGIVLASGFFLAGRQHFSSMDYGMKNSRLRKQIDDLESEKRRLLLSREVALSPLEVKKAVKRAGLFEVTQSETQIAQVAQVSAVTKDKAVPTVPAIVKPMVEKTASVSPVRPKTAPVPAAAVTTAELKPERAFRLVKKAPSAE